MPTKNYSITKKGYFNIRKLLPMRIKIFIPASLFIALLCCSLKCRKDKDKPPDTLPPITQEGKNTFGCKVDGEIWVPYYKCGGSGNPCGELASDVYQTDVSSKLPLSFSITFGERNSDNSSTRFSISTKQNQGITSIGNKSDSVVINFRKNDGSLYYNYNYYNKLEKFEVTKLDATNKMISGIFDATLYKSVTDSVKITEGRFDLKFQACQCSN